ncbi:hypothetical protein ALC60_05967 [Trachymyrmex zeteki]|uniref:Uncharacterized protein n=1 Tax=Mycetomoellerius zeteki TaxID=64791 RepID=A0A151X3X0_9HYME|nr:hypothetical protein ALC60_05967 [Trachymyrmex zeteki]
MLLHDFLHLIYNYEDLINYLCDMQVIRREVMCPRYQQIMHLCHTSTSLIIQCVNNYYKQVQIRQQSGMLGSRDVIVEVDEAKIGRRKYNRGEPLYNSFATVMLFAASISLITEIHTDDVVYNYKALLAASVSIMLYL